jgi:hypothetical protein
MQTSYPSDTYNQPMVSAQQPQFSYSLHPQPAPYTTEFSPPAQQPTSYQHTLVQQVQPVDSYESVPTWNYDTDVPVVSKIRKVSDVNLIRRSNHHQQQRGAAQDVFLEPARPVSKQPSKEEEPTPENKSEDSTKNENNESSSTTTSNNNVDNNASRTEAEKKDNDKKEENTIPDSCHQKTDSDSAAKNKPDNRSDIKSSDTSTNGNTPTSSPLSSRKGCSADSTWKPATPSGRPPSSIDGRTTPQPTEPAAIVPETPPTPDAGAESVDIDSVTKALSSLDVGTTEETLREQQQN